MPVVRVTLARVSSTPSISSRRLLPSGGSEDSHDGFQITFDPEEEPLEEVIPNAVAVIHNVAPEELDPLFDTIDPDMIHRLLWPSTDRQSGVLEITFAYEGLKITIEQSGTVQFEWQ